MTHLQSEYIPLNPLTTYRTIKRASFLFLVVRRINMFKSSVSSSLHSMSWTKLADALLELQLQPRS